MIFTSTRRMLSDPKLRLRARIRTPLLRSTSVSIPALIILVLDVTGASRMHALTGSSLIRLFMIAGVVGV